MANLWGKVETVIDFILGGSKITVDSDCSHEIKRHLAPWKESYDKPRLHIKKKRCHFANKGTYSQSYGFSSSHVWMWELDHKEGWMMNYAFKLWYWRRLLRVPWTAKRSNQSVLTEINPDYSLKELMLKLKLQYFSHLMWRADTLEKTLMLRKTEGKSWEEDSRGWDA